jgi:hypothetical protein
MMLPAEAAHLRTEHIYMILYMADNIYISHNEKEREIEIGIEERPLTSKRLCIGIPNI